MVRLKIKFDWLTPRLTPQSQLSVLAGEWFPNNTNVQNLFLRADARTFLKTFNLSLPAEHRHVLSAEMICAQVRMDCLNDMLKVCIPDVTQCTF